MCYQQYRCRPWPSLQGILLSSQLLALNYTLHCICPKAVIGVVYVPQITQPHAHLHWTSSKISISWHSWLRHRPQRGQARSQSHLRRQNFSEVWNTVVGGINWSTCPGSWWACYGRRMTRNFTAPEFQVALYTNGMLLGNLRKRLAGNAGPEVAWEVVLVVWSRRLRWKAACRRCCLPDSSASVCDAPACPSRCHGNAVGNGDRDRTDDKHRHRSTSCLLLLLKCHGQSDAPAVAVARRSLRPPYSSICTLRHKLTDRVLSMLST